MPASSKSQQRLFGMIHAYNKGELKNPPKIIKEIAKSMKKKDVKDFASTKHKGLPKKIKKKKSMLNIARKLATIANYFDEEGLIEESDIVDSIMSRITNEF